MLWLIGTSTTIKAAGQESYDYTLQKCSEHVTPITAEAFLDIEEIPKELSLIATTIFAARQDDTPIPQLLTMVVEDLQKQQYYKYLFASSGLVEGIQAQQKAHQLNYHLVKAPAGPVMWQVLSFLRTNVSYGNHQERLLSD